jgi:hypothetical protein
MSLEMASLVQSKRHSLVMIDMHQLNPLRDPSHMVEHR